MSVQSESMVTTDKEAQTVENASGCSICFIVSTMLASSLISNLNSVTDDSDEDDYVSDEDYDYENNPMVEFDWIILTKLKEQLVHFQNSGTKIDKIESDIRN